MVVLPVLFATAAAAVLPPMVWIDKVMVIAGTAAIGALAAWRLVTLP